MLQSFFSLSCCKSNLCVSGFPKSASRVTSAPLEESDGRARPAPNAFEPPFHPPQPKETPTYLQMNDSLWFCLQTGRSWEAGSPVEMLHEGFFLSNLFNDKA